MSAVRRAVARLLWVSLATLAFGVAAQQPPAGRGQGPQTVPEDGFFFIQLSDTQFGFSSNDVDFVQDTVSAKFVVATVNRLAPAFVIVTGDLVNKPGDVVQVAEYQRIMEQVDPSIPLYSVAGNHDVENEPTAASLAAYREAFGREYYSFRSGSLFGIVLNSTIIHTPTHVPDELAMQDRWLREEIETGKASGARHVVVFQHHPWFLKKAYEPDQYFNIPLVRRDPLLALFRAAGIELLVSGHLHRSVEATDAGVRSVVTGPVGRPLGGGQSGFRVFVVTDTEITSRYYGFGEVPYRLGPPT